MGKYSWFQTFAVFWTLYVFFWVFPRRLIVVCRRFGTLYLFHLHRLDMKYEVRSMILHPSYPAYEDGTDRVFRNVGIQQSDAGEIPKRIHTKNMEKHYVFKSFFWKYQGLSLRRLNGKEQNAEDYAEMHVPCGPHFPVFLQILGRPGGFLLTMDAW